MGVDEFSEEEMTARHGKVAGDSALRDRALARAMDPSPTPTTSAGELAQSIARRHGVAASDLTAHRRTNALVRARFEWWAALRAQGRSFPEIGRLACRDHTTIIAGVRRYEQMQRERLRAAAGEL
jgi:chromosomal replication initiation ATPase DnaA